MTDKMNITPPPHLIYSLRAQRFNSLYLIGEAVDNAFDATATFVATKIKPDEITFSDDGVGITLARMGALFTPGSHMAHVGTQLGRFGVGIKAQAISAGDVFIVVSVSNEGRLSAQVNWRELAKQPNWEMDRPRQLPVAVGTPTGTSITIRNLTSSASVSDARLCEQLALRFHPALIQGRRIIVNDAEIKPLPEPKLTDVVRDERTFPGGRSATLIAGILRHPSKTLDRVHVGYEHRIIMPRSEFGCGTYGGLNRLHARIQLSGRWKLEVFKNDLTDAAERDELEEWAFDLLKPLLDKVSSASFDAKIDRIEQLIHDLVPRALMPARPQRGQKTKSTSGKKQHNRGEVKMNPEPEGPARARLPKGTLTITLDGNPQEDGVGSCTKNGRRYRVRLSRGIPLIDNLIESRDERLAAQMLLAVALMVYEETRPGGGLEFDGPFGVRVAQLLAGQEDEPEAPAKLEGA